MSFLFKLRFVFIFYAFNFTSFLAQHTHTHTFFTTQRPTAHFWRLVLKPLLFAAAFICAIFFSAAFIQSFEMVVLSILVGRFDNAITVSIRHCANGKYVETNQDGFFCEDKSNWCGKPQAKTELSHVGTHHILRRWLEWVFKKRREKNTHTHTRTLLDKRHTIDLFLFFCASSLYFRYPGHRKVEVCVCVWARAHATEILWKIWFLNDEQRTTWH